MSRQEPLSAPFPTHTAAGEGGRAPSPVTLKSYSVHFVLFVRQEGNADGKDPGQGQGGRTW